MNLEQSRYVNDYIARMSYMLDEVHNECDTFVYYNIENSQAKMVPSHTPLTGPIRDTDESNTRTISRILEEGFDFYYADRDDLVAAEESLKKGEALISGCRVKNIIVSECNVIYDDSIKALKALSNAGVNVIFVDQVPSVSINGKCVSYEKIQCSFDAITLDQAIDALRNAESDFTASADDIVLMKSKYIKENTEMYFLHNNTRGVDGKVRLNHKNKKQAKIYNPADGSITDINMGETFRLPSYRGVFIVF